MSQIINYFRSLFHPSLNSDRKRRRTELSDSAEPSIPKYRRVNSHFPKQYPKPINDGEIDFYHEVRQKQPIIREIVVQHLMDQNKQNFKPFLDDDDDDEFSDEDVSSFRVPAPSQRRRDQQPSTSGYNFSSSKQSTPGGVPGTRFSGSTFSGFQKIDSSKMTVPTRLPMAKPRTKMPGLLPIKQAVVINGFTANGFCDEVPSQQSQSRKSIINFGSKKSFGEPAFRCKNSVMDRNHNLELKNHYDNLLRSLIPTTQTRTQYQKYSPGLKPINNATSKKPIVTIDLSKDDDATEDIVEVPVTSLHSASYQRRSSDFLPSRKLFDFGNLTYDDKEFNIGRTPSTLLSSTRLAQRDGSFKSPVKSEKSSASSSIPDIQPINSLKERQSGRSCLQHDQIESIVQKFTESRKQIEQRIDQENDNVFKLSNSRVEKEREQQRQIRDTISSLEQCIIIDEEEERVDEFVRLDERQMSLVRNALQGGQRYDTVVSKFNMNITRNDLMTLVGDSWLNDEVINFYMELLKERSELSDHLPKCHTMNTFFVQKLLQTGQAGVRRWTRRVDIFSFDIIPIPVHVGGVHWCMSIIDFREKTIKYYDSMGHPNQRVLDALEDYLKEESMDKKKQIFDMSEWSKENVRDCPRQMNGSDCGVFSCMFAEFLSRDSKISFNQQHMQYFRTKMVYEIASGKLLLN